MNEHFTSEANMPRILIIGASFLTVTLALILLQPNGDSTAETQVEPEANTVARADTGVLSLVDDDVSLLREAAAATTPNVEDAIVQDVAMNLTAEAKPPADSITAGVLASLSAATGTTPEPAIASNTASAGNAEQDMLRDLTSSVLSGLKNGKSEGAGSSMEQLVVQALQQGQSDSYIEAMVNAAADAGSIEVPRALRTGEGRVDTGTLLAELVRKSDPNAAELTPIGESEGVEVRVVQRANETRQYNFYTVQSGDSLGAIAHRFYGDAALYITIFDANRQFLSRPDRIRVGQRLSIPAQGSST